MPYYLFWFKSPVRMDICSTHTELLDKSIDYNTNNPNHEVVTYIYLFTWTVEMYYTYSRSEDP